MIKALLENEDLVVEKYDFFCRKLRISSSTPKGLAAFRSYLEHGMKLPDHLVKRALNKVNEKYRFERHC